jgi:hypothetical protein
MPGSLPDAFRTGLAAEVFEAAVDRFGGAVGCAGPVEVGEHVGGALGQGAAERDDLGCVA